MKTVKQMLYGGFLLLVVWPCKAIFEGWKAYIFKRDIASRIKNAGYQPGEGHKERNDTEPKWKIGSFALLHLV